MSKLKKQKYQQIEDGIYRCGEGNDTLYVTSLSFVQEPEYEEGTSAGDISQYPLEDILDQFFCHISDLYEELNVPGSEVCCPEFAARDAEDIRNLRGIIGKHVYNADCGVNGQTIVKLVVE